uniref:ubiquitinyl hydrolase 1 n=1 Tax=Phallusia mammillata TaxID=59560 RepID=A0A6F9DVT3_9ASCI|nr:ubiquitin carboxyl-terminal hydrolase 32 [Phallusia mammillata]
MGARESRASILSYDEAAKRVTDTELKRIQAAYKRACGYAGVMRELVFVRDVLGESVPQKLAQRIFAVMSTSSRGLTFRDLLVTLVLLTRGRSEERLKLVFAVYCDENGAYVTSQSMSNMVSACEKTALPYEAFKLFKLNDRVPYDQFRKWIMEYPSITSVTRWLANSSGVVVSLTDHTEMPNFYQTLAGVTHLEESDITELEKRYWQLKSQSKTGRFDLATFKGFVCPPLPECLVQGLFNAFDENKDGHIDFKEISCGVSACCRGPSAERQKFCFKIFDLDRDNVLNESEVQAMANALLQVKDINIIQTSFSNGNSAQEKITDVIKRLSAHSGSKGSVTLEEYQLWSLDDPLPENLLKVVIEICHIILGLQPLSPQEEGAIVKGWMKRSCSTGYKPGETWFLISGKWWNQWKKHTQYNPSFNNSSSDLESYNGMSESSSCDTIASVQSTASSENISSGATKSNHRFPGKAQRLSKTSTASNTSVNSPPGPINNSDILAEEHLKVGTLTDEGGRVKNNLTRGVDYEILPEPVWKALFHWYGGSPSLPRIVPAPNADEKPWLEIFRLHVVLLRHQIPSTPQVPQNPLTSGPTGSVSTPMGVLRHSLNYVMGSSNTPKRHVMHRATFSRRHTVGQVSLFLSNRLRIPIDNMRLWHLLDENNANLLEDETVKLEILNISNNAQILLEVRNVDMSWPEELSQIARNHKQKIKGQEGSKVSILRGTSGLSNLGNTCFMNSGIQCLSSTQPLTQYFLEEKHLYELNRTNPIGMKGHIAKRYSDLSHELWSGTNKTVAPLKLRWTISKYAPRFNGFSQHDSQELLAFLLDGLHEDLNRVHEKPYVELKDSDGRPDEEVAQEAWENHLSRNQSIIVDLFHGQIRSKVRCLECNSLSVTFDPFTFLSLPLPMDNSMYLDVIVIRLDGKTPIRFGLRLGMDETILEVRRLLANKCKLSIEAILLAEIVGATIKSFLSDNAKVRTSALGNLYAYEIPPPKKAALKTNEAKLPNGTATNHKQPQNSTKTSNGSNSPPTGYKTHVGSSVHETNKQSITNHSAVKAHNLNDKSDNADTPTDSKAMVNGNDAVAAENSNMNGNVAARLLGRKTRTKSQEAHSGSGDNNSDVTTTSSLPQELVNYPGYVVAFHRKIFHMDVYFLSSQKHRPSLFGFPIVVPCVPGQSRRALYSTVWQLVARFVSPLPANEPSGTNHAQDCDDSLGSQYPFMLRCVENCGLACGNKCPWFSFCNGCQIPCDDGSWEQASGFLAIDWDPTALHLRYQPTVEREVKDDSSVEEGHRGQQQRIDLNHCLRAFTSEEELGKDELYHCSKCKKLQLAKKKLDIWRLPPVLIIHLKRFQLFNGRWIKSHKVVDFPQTDFDPSSFMSINDKADLESSEPTSPLPVLPEPLEENSKDIEFAIASNSNGGTKSPKPKHISFAENEATSSPQSNSVRPRTRSAGTARCRQPSFREDSPPLYDLYAISCHSGILGGGHYIAYAKNKTTGKWYCYNDSSCKEVPADSISVETAYTLFYQRQGIDYDEFMPSVEGKSPVNTDSMDDDFNSDYKRYCVIQ